MQARMRVCICRYQNQVPLAEWSQFAHLPRPWIPPQRFTFIHQDICKTVLSSLVLASSAPTQAPSACWLCNMPVDLKWWTIHCRDYSTDIRVESRRPIGRLKSFIETLSFAFHGLYFRFGNLLMRPYHCDGLISCEADQNDTINMFVSVAASASTWELQQAWDNQINALIGK